MLQMQPRSGRKSTAKYPDLGGGETYLWAFHSLSGTGVISASFPRMGPSDWRTRDP